MDYNGSRVWMRAKGIREQTGVDSMPVAIKRKKRGGGAWTGRVMCRPARVTELSPKVQ